jgi:geranylgeranyl diphosphate synthase, type II
MILPEVARRIINQELERIPLSQQPVELYDPIAYILALGGKRLRPVLTLMCSSLFNSDERKALPAALAIEVFHNFTLLHDDIMDKAPLRRNKPTVHEKWNPNVAILSGDAMLIKAYELVTTTDSSILKSVLQVFNQTALEVCEGQQFDMNYESMEFVSEVDYLRMIELKTSVLIAASMKIGAICGGASPQTAEYLYQAGLQIGLAFQIQDDWLDSFGNADVFGKTIGGDIAANKKTWLFIKSLELADEEDKRFLLHAFASKPLNPEEKVQAVQSLFKKYGVDKKADELVRSYSQQAVEFLERAAIKKEDLKILQDLIEGLMCRET